MEQEQDMNYGNESYTTPMSQFGGSIVLMTDPTDVLNSLELGLRNIYVQNGKYIQAGKPLMNDEGIRAMITISQAFISRNTIMSSIDHKEQGMFIKDLTDVLCYELMLNKIKYEISPPYDATRKNIANILRVMTKICLKRATEEGLSDKNFWKSTQQDTTIRHESQANKKGKLAGWIPTGWQ